MGARVRQPPREGTQALGDLIRSGRKAHGWTLREMGEVFDVHHMTVLHWEKGRMRPGHATMAKMADVFGIPLDRFYEAARIIPPDMTDFIRHNPRLMQQIRQLMSRRGP